MAGLGSGGLVAARLALPELLRPGPVRPLSGSTRSFVERCFDGLDRAAIWDVHVHLVGLGDDGTGCWVNPDMRSHLHPKLRLQFDVYIAAAGVRADGHLDQAYLERLLELHRAGNPEGKLMVVALDWTHDASGAPLEEASAFHVPNDYVLAVADDNDDVVACASVHPYRRDALQELERVVARGARAIKWLPNAMGIDPASASCDAFYAKLVELERPLLTHAGHEAAVESGESQELGNPCRLRRPLEAGVRVIAAHCAGTGAYVDPDRPGSAERASFDLFMELMRDPRFESNLLSDVSAVTQINRCGPPLEHMLRAESLHPRLLFGSDYPLPAIDPINSTWLLERRGYITSEEREHCNAVFDANPLLFDFVVKRCLRVDHDGRRVGFADAVFETARFLT